MSGAHAFGCAGDRACSCGCDGASAGSSGSSEAAYGLGAGMDPLSMLIDTGAAFLPVPGPIQNAAAQAAHQMVNPEMLPPEARAALDAAKRNLEAQAQQAAQAAEATAANVAAKRPRIVIPKKRGMRRGTKIALAVGGGLLVAGGIALKVAL